MPRYLLFASQLYSLDILRPVERAARARGFEVAWFLQVGQEFLDPDARILATPRDVMEWNPDAVIVPGNWVPPFFPGVKVEIFHGFRVEKPPADRHFRVRGTFDLYCTQGPTSTDPFQELAARHGYYRVTETGWSKVDPLFQDDPAPRPGDGRPTILFGSTFTPRLAAAPHLVEEIARMASAGTWRWLVTLHPKMEPEVIAKYRALEGPSLSFIETPELLPAIKAADAMLCDTSSIATEFLLQQRPVVTFRTVSPGAHLVDVLETDQVEGALARALEHPPELLAEIDAFTRGVHPYRDGRSSERVLDAVEAFRREGRVGLGRKPWRPLRALKARRKLGYWGPGA